MCLLLLLVVVLYMNVLYISSLSGLADQSFKVHVSLLIVCLDDLSIAVSGALKSSIIVLLYVSLFRSI